MLEPMRSQAESAGLEDLRRRLEQTLADAALVERLEAIRLNVSGWVEGQVNDPRSGQDYAAAFRDAGLAQEGDDTETVAARIGASAIREQLAAALDDWATITDDPPRSAWLLEVARRADPDPWRDRFRDPAVRINRLRLECTSTKRFLRP